MITTVETKQGYQKTKLGWIPVDWEVVKFSQVADNDIRWSLTGGPFGSDLKSSDYTKSGVRILQLQNIGDGEFKDTYKIYTSEKKADELISCNIYPSEIILSKMGDPVARACVIPHFESRFLMASDGIRLVCNKAKFDNIFVLEYINFNIFRSIAIRRSTGSTRQRIGLKDLKKIPFPLPPLPEQKKIAKILSTWDTAITKTKALIQKKQELKKGLMQVLLIGKVRFKEFVEEEVWQKLRIDELGRVESGGTPSTTVPEYWNGDVNWCIPTDITKLGENKYIGNTIKKITNLGLQKSSAKKISINSVIVCTRATIGAVAINTVEMTTNQGFKTIVPYKEVVSYEFLYYKVLSLKKELLKLCSGSTFLEISKKDFSSIKLNLPSLLEQKKIAKVLSSCDQSIEKLNKQLQQLQAQKKGLMQQLLTGATRVSI